MQEKGVETSGTEPKDMGTLPPINPALKGMELALEIDRRIRLVIERLTAAGQSPQDILLGLG